MNKALEELEKEYKGLSSLNKEHTFHYNDESKYFTVLDSKVYAKRKRFTVYENTVYSDFGYEYNEVDILRKIWQLKYGKLQQVELDTSIEDKVSENETVYVIELQECCWFRGTFKESQEFDTRRTIVLNFAKKYMEKSIAELECENIVNAGKFKNAKVIPYVLKPKTKFQQMQRRYNDLDISFITNSNIMRQCQKRNEVIDSKNQQYKQLLDKIEVTEPINNKFSDYGVKVKEQWYILPQGLYNILKQLKEVK